LGDTTWCRGKVIGKHEAEGEKIVECEVWCENQRGERTAMGSATASLPSKEQDA
jgi:hypothetical protein